jgi:hypothetical protein
MRSAGMSHPYAKLEDYQFWPKAMTAPAPGHVNPALPMQKMILPGHKIASIGSCFAQHLARHILRSGLDYLVTEKAPEGVDPVVARQRNFGVFSARYGNVYTVRQAVQLFDRAFAAFTPVDVTWQRDEVFVDPFRPGIEPGGFKSPEALAEDVVRHLACVREVFLQADWIIFTLGLTEAWRSKADGAIYPIAPGVAGGVFDPERHEFVNFTAGEVAADLCALRERIHQINPNAKIMLTVSPVPLAATYENRHVWLSTTYSKAALRVAADEVVRKFENVFYFPSYEIITSPAAGNRYYDDDLRSITEPGVNHVMRVFFRSCCQLPDEQESASVAQHAIDGLVKDMEIVCDEDMIAQAVQGTASPAPQPGVKQEDFDEALYLQLNPDVAKAFSDVLALGS